MMMRRTAYAGLLGLAVALIVSPPGVAAPLDEISADLQQQGYRIVDVRRTWLGRIQITAERDGFHREIVFDRTTGEIRRDLVEDEAKPGPAGQAKSLKEVIDRSISQIPKAPAKTPKPAVAGRPAQPGAAAQVWGSLARERGQAGNGCSEARYAGSRWRASFREPSAAWPGAARRRATSSTGAAETTGDAGDGTAGSGGGGGAGIGVARRPAAGVSGKRRGQLRQRQRREQRRRQHHGTDGSGSSESDSSGSNNGSGGGSGGSSGGESSGGGDSGSSSGSSGGGDASGAGDSSSSVGGGGESSSGSDTDCSGGSSDSGASGSDAGGSELSETGG